MKQLIIILFLLTGVDALAIAPIDIYVTIGYKGDLDNLVEKKKAIIYSYKLNSKDPVQIENHFGDVKVKFWSKEEVQVKIVITANAPTKEKVDAFIKIVEIESSKENGIVNFTTKLNCLKSSFVNNINKGNDKGDQNFLRVDYLVYMPEGHNLTVNNSHGDVYIPKFRAVLNIRQDYGTLFADHLSNVNSSIEVAFGKAFIKSMNGGKLKAKQTALLIDKVENLTLTNTGGNVQVLEAVNSKLEATYTKGYVAKVNESCKFVLNYSKEFRLGEILENVKELEIESLYTNLELPLCVSGKYDFWVEAQKTDLQIKDEPKVRFISTSNVSKKHYMIGHDNSAFATKVMLSANYGRVRLK